MRLTPCNITPDRDGYPARIDRLHVRRCVLDFCDGVRIYCCHVVADGEARIVRVRQCANGQWCFEGKTEAELEAERQAKRQAEREAEAAAKARANKKAVVKAGKKAMLQSLRASRGAVSSR